MTACENLGVTNPPMQIEMSHPPRGLKFKICTQRRCKTGELASHRQTLPIINIMGWLRANLPAWIINWLPAFIGVFVIALESTATMSSENTSRWLMPYWFKFFGSVTPARWEEIHFLLRKSGHFLGYGLLSLAFYRGWRRTLRNSRRHSVWYHRLHAAWWALFWTLVVATADEYHQSFLSTRTSSPYDVCLDVCGAIAAHVMLFLALRFLWRQPFFRSGSGREWV
jgi:VanZ family protein